MYVPLGELLPGMGYLVRRLLENTSNESFLRHTFFDEDEVSTLLKEPVMHGDDGGSGAEHAPLSPPEDRELATPTPDTDLS
jgi:RHH-type proline utilization regulon transcriptional repressor/proline dehydrogenase/delta 1-pyrroline-5-carboxylate dehydrogenase